MSYVVLAMIIGAPFVAHWSTYDRSKASAISAIFMGLAMAIYSYIASPSSPGKSPLSIGGAVAILVTVVIVGFVFSYLVGMVFWAMGSWERRDFAAERAKQGPSPRRQKIGGFGAIAITIVICMATAAQLWHTGNWEKTISLKFTLALVAFFGLGVATLLNVYGTKRRDKDQFKDTSPIERSQQAPNRV